MGDTMRRMASHDLGVLLGSDYLAGIETLSMQTLRGRRGDCQEVEVALSYLRRLVQGRMDIVLAELRRRASGEDPVEVHELIAELPHILSDRVRAPGNGRLPTIFAPNDIEVDQLLLDRLDRIAGPGWLSSLPDLEEAELRTAADALTQLEREVSDTRRAVFERIDAIQGEIVRRYKSGEANVDSLLS
jgi:hypothetical protein